MTTRLPDSQTARQTEPGNWVRRAEVQVPDMRSTQMDTAVLIHTFPRSDTGAAFAAVDDRDTSFTTKVVVP